MTSRLAIGCALGLALLASAGCASRPAPFYPLGIYSVKTTNDLAEVKAAGFNVVRGTSNKAFLDNAQKYDLKVLATPGLMAGPKYNEARAREVIRQADSHPALWAWYLSDEPDLNRVAPEEVLRSHRVVKSMRASKPTVVVLYQGASGLHYGDIPDILMVDRYPVPWLPLASFPQHVRQARLSVGKQKPLIAVIQAFDWSYYKRLMPEEKNLREPTSAELRCMIYSALAQRATGLFFYSYSDGQWKIREHPELWNAVKDAVAEVNQRMPLFQAEHVWWIPQMRYGNYAERWNEALESSVQTALLRVGTGNEFVPPGEYILAVNTTGKKQSCAILGPASVGNAAPVLGENRSAMAKQNWIADAFEPYQVHIYGPFARQ